MLSLQTTDTWGLATVDITVGANTETWTGSDTYNSAADAIENLMDWANAAARPWFGVALFSWRWTRDTALSGALLYLTNSGGVFTYAPNATAQTLLGIPNRVGVLEAIGSASAAGTWAPRPDGFVPLRLGEGWVRGAGNASGGGAVRPGVPALGQWSARSTTACEVLEAARWTDVLQDADHPRRAWLRLSNVSKANEIVTDLEADAGWLLVALGRVQRSRPGTSIWLITLDLASDAAV